MNLFLSTLGVSGNNVNAFGVFFTINQQGKVEIEKEIFFERNNFFIDVLSKSQELAFLENIFYVSGPASFTGLRNMSVFLNTFSIFSENIDKKAQKKIHLFSVPTGEFLDICFPFSDANILKSGRREAFVFEKSSSRTGEKNIRYTKMKNTELLQYLETKNTDVLGGQFSEDFLKENGEKFTFSFSEPQEEILQKIYKKKERLKVECARVDYGSLPTIG